MSAFRVLRQDEIEEILRRHREWVEADGSSGEPADLSRAALSGADFAGRILTDANLAGADLAGADFRGAILAKADLGGADLTGADLRNAVLSRANLDLPDLPSTGRGRASDASCLEQSCDDPEPTCLTGARLHGADLSDARLAGVCGLLAASLAGADLSNAKLPGDIARFDGLGHVAETSRNAATVFFGLLGACLYSCLTIATTTHAGLVIGTDDLTLPVIGAPIPTTEFYLAAPIMLLMMYVYFHLYLERLWVGLASLPAVFPDGKSLDEKAYPWICNAVARAHFRRLAPRRGMMTRLEYFVTVALGWFVVPATLAYFWLDYLPMHHWPVTGAHLALMGAAVLFGIYSYHVAVRTLRGEAVDTDRAGKGATRTTMGFWTILAGVFVVMILMTKGVHDRTFPDDPSSGTWSERLLRSRLGAWTFLDIRGVDISARPPNWTGASDAELALVKGADLQGADLRHMSAEGAFFVKARLRGADLRGARLALAEFRQAVFTVRRDSARGGFAAEAASGEQERREIDCLRGRDAASLRGADIWRADLREAELCGVDLAGAILVQAKLSGADLRRADLEKADLGGADLLPVFSDKFGTRATDLSMANLAGANLRDAKLVQAVLAGADLRGAILRNADLRQADLSKARNLRVDQVREACIDGKTMLPPGMREELGSTGGSCDAGRGGDADVPNVAFDQNGDKGISR